MSTMKFNLSLHNKKYEETGMPHRFNCFCKRFKDGEDMWPPKPVSGVSDIPVWVEPKEPVARDPSQSEQPWEASRQDGKEMGKLFDQE